MFFHLYTRLFIKYVCYSSCLLSHVVCKRVKSWSTTVDYKLPCVILSMYFFSYTFPCTFDFVQLYFPDACYINTVIGLVYYLVIMYLFLISFYFLSCHFTST